MSDGSTTATTDGTGAYTFATLADGSYTLTPSLAGYTFSPATISATVSGADVTGQDFVATRVYTISGTVAGMDAGIDVVLEGGASPDTVQTTAAARFPLPASAGNYTVTPDASNHRVTPGSFDVTGLSADQSDVDFTAVAVYAVSGTVVRLNGDGADGTTVTLSGDESASTTVGSDGSYAFRVPDGSYTVTPSRTDWGFAPTDSSFAVAGAAVADVDFVTRTVLRTPTLVAPADAATDAPLTPTFEWTHIGPTPDTWTLRIDDDSDVTDAPLATLKVDG